MGSVVVIVDFPHGHGPSTAADLARIPCTSEVANCPPEIIVIIGVATEAPGRTQILWLIGIQTLRRDLQRQERDFTKPGATRRCYKEQRLAKPDEWAL